MRRDRLHAIIDPRIDPPERRIHPTPRGLRSVTIGNGDILPLRSGTGSLRREYIISVKPVDKRTQHTQPTILR